MPRTVEGGSNTEEAELGLHDYLRMLWRRKIVIVVVVVVVVVVVIGLDSQKVRVYQGKASLLLTPSVSRALDAAGNGGGGVGTVDAPTAVRVLESEATSSAAAAILKVSVVPSAVAAQAGTTSVVSVTVQSTDAAFAAQAANAYANAYITKQQSQAINSLTDASTQISAKISALDAQLTSVQNQIGAVTAQEQPLPTASGVPGPAEPTPAQAAQISALTLQQTTLNEQESAFKQELGQVQLAANLAGGGGQLVNPATTDRTPVSPKTFRDIIVALGIGLALGLGLALLREVLDNRIRGKEDLERVGIDLPVMGLIPLQPEWRDTSKAIVASIEQPDSGASEAYRSLRTSIQFLDLDRPIHSLQVTSPATSEGKTTTLINLAIALARAGQQVVIVDCDLRRPRVHQFFDLNQDPGFTSVLLGELPLFVALQSVDAVDGLRVLTSGRVPPNPSELLSGQRTSEIFDALRSECDLVLIDSPPLLPVSDGAVIAARVDASLIVVNNNETRRKQLIRALELLRQVDARVIGTVLNRVVKNAVDYGYSYGYRPYVAKSASARGNGKSDGKAQVRSKEGPRINEKDEQQNLPTVEGHTTNSDSASRQSEASRGANVETTNPSPALIEVTKTDTSLKSEG